MLLIPTSVLVFKIADGSLFVWLLTGQRCYMVYQCLLLNFILFLRQICFTAQGVLLRQRHSRSNTNHLGSLSNGQSCIHLSPFLLCCLIESCDLCFALQALSWRRRRRSQAYWWLAVCLGSHRIMFLRSGQWTLFFQGFSFDNVLLFVFTRRLQISKFQIVSPLVMQFQNSALISTLRVNLNSKNQSHRLIPEKIAWRDCPDLRFVCIWSWKVKYVSCVMNELQARFFYVSQLL